MSKDAVNAPEITTLMANHVIGCMSDCVANKCSIFEMKTTTFD